MENLDIESATDLDDNIHSQYNCRDLNEYKKALSTNPEVLRAFTNSGPGRKCALKDDSEMRPPQSYFTRLANYYSGIYTSVVDDIKELGKSFVSLPHEGYREKDGIFGFDALVVIRMHGGVPLFDETSVLEWLPKRNERMIDLSLLDSGKEKTSIFADVLNIRDYPFHLNIKQYSIPGCNVSPPLHRFETFHEYYDNNNASIHEEFKRDSFSLTKCFPNKAKTLPNILSTDTGVEFEESDIFINKKKYNGEFPNREALMKIERRNMLDPCEFENVDFLLSKYYRVKENDPAFEDRGGVYVMMKNDFNIYNLLWYDSTNHRDEFSTNVPGVIYKGLKDLLFNYNRDLYEKVTHSFQTDKWAQSIISRIGDSAHNRDNYEYNRLVNDSLHEMKTEVKDNPSQVVISFILKFCFDLLLEIDKIHPARNVGLIEEIKTTSEDILNILAVFHYGKLFVQDGSCNGFIFQNGYKGQLEIEETLPIKLVGKLLERGIGHGGSRRRVRVSKKTPKMSSRIKCRTRKSRKSIKTRKSRVNS